MKNIIKGFILIGIVMVLVSCGNEGETSETEVLYEEEIETQEEETVDDIEEQETETETQIVDEYWVRESETDKTVDVDLTELSATMVYAEVYNMFENVNDYVGKVIKMQGSFFVYEEPTTRMIYFSVIIQDALACCSQGIEFELADEYAYPEDYPEEWTEVSVVGEFELYEEDGNWYCRLKDSVFLPVEE